MIDGLIYQVYPHLKTQEPTIPALFVYITCASSEEAAKIAQNLVELRIAACANIMAPHRSFYWWDGAVQQAEEVVLIVKTRSSLFAALEKNVLKIHSYECPCIVALPIEKAHQPFLDWIEKETAG